MAVLKPRESSERDVWGGLFSANTFKVSRRLQEKRVRAALMCVTKPLAVVVSTVTSPLAPEPPVSGSTSILFIIIMFCSASLFPSPLLLLLVTLFQPSGRLYLPPISLISGLCCEHFTLPIFFSLFQSQNPPSLQCGLCVFSFLCVFLLCTQRCLFLRAQDPKITIRVCVINCLN